jgi:spore coat protein CotF|tara:strand:+ start:190 stop:462 length:273 start_codon:yes stop_codon:yes gene_type:complete
MAQHTPGPWTIYEPEKDITAYDKVADRTVTVAMMCDDAGLEREANADLIAAAPDMRQALLDLVNWYDMDEGDLQPIMNAARVVLARVEKL